MKRLFLFLASACLAAPLMAEYDDIYSDFAPKQAADDIVIEDDGYENTGEPVGQQRKTRDIDEYNRQYTSSASANETIEFEDQEDFAATKRIVKYHNSDAVTINDPQYVYIYENNDSERQDYEAGDSDAAASFAAGYLLGIIGFSKSLAKEIGSRGIRCNAIAPGLIESAMTQAMPKEAHDKWLSEIPLRRGGTDLDIARTSLFLASDLSEYITGQVICVDGGVSL